MKLCMVCLQLGNAGKGTNLEKWASFRWDTKILVVTGEVYVGTTLVSQALSAGRVSPM